MALFDILGKKLYNWKREKIYIIATIYIFIFIVQVIRDQPVLKSDGRSVNSYLWSIHYVANERLVDHLADIMKLTQGKLLP